jgi:hypothetical protein
MRAGEIDQVVISRMLTASDQRTIQRLYASRRLIANHRGLRALAEQMCARQVARRHRRVAPVLREQLAAAAVTTLTAALNDGLAARGLRLATDEVLRRLLDAFANADLPDERQLHQWACAAHSRHVPTIIADHVAADPGRWVKDVLGPVRHRRLIRGFPQAASVNLNAEDQLAVARIGRSTFDRRRRQRDGRYNDAARLTRIKLRDTLVLILAERMRVDAAIVAQTIEPA